MKLSLLKANMTELSEMLTSEGQKLTVLFSYQTPVAAFISGRGYIKTSTKWSVTTSRHINQWLHGIKAEEVEQSFLDDMITTKE